MSYKSLNTLLLTAYVLGGGSPVQAKEPTELECQVSQEGTTEIHCEDENRIIYVNAEKQTMAETNKNTGTSIFYGRNKAVSVKEGRRTEYELRKNTPLKKRKKQLALGINSAKIIIKIP